MGSSQPNCKFCKIIEDKNEILYEDDKIVIFNDIQPEAEIHLLVCPKVHLKNVNSLTENELDLLNHMENKAKEYLKFIKGEDDYEYKMGFHIPPLLSVNHLHLHVLVPPFVSGYKKYIEFGFFLRSLENQKNLMKKLNN